MEAISKICDNGSIARTKRSGKRGSPLRKPRPWWMGAPGIPFKSTREGAVKRSAAIQLQNLLGKPLLCNRSTM
jgi:hypothetical protein